MQEEGLSRKAHFFMKEGRAGFSCLRGDRDHGVARMEAHGHPLLGLEAWLEWCRLERCVCLGNSTLEAFP